MNSIQVFWLVAFGVAERIAISPPSGPICSASSLHLRAAEILGGGLVDEQVAALGIGVGVIGDDLDALRARLVQRRHDRVRDRWREMTIASCFCVVSVLM